MSSRRSHRMDTGRAECQKFLMEFKVHQLRELLKSVSLSTKGRKAELFQRANDLLSHGSPQIQQYIRDIYLKNHCKRNIPLKYGKMPSTLPYSHMKDMMQHHTPKSHFNNTVVPKSGEGSYILHPDVIFKQLPFYRLLETIIRPTTLVSTAITSNGSNSMRLQFHLTPQQVKLISGSKTSQGKYGNKLLLRFARKESSCEQDDFYPKQCYVKVNTHYCVLPGYSPQLSLRPDYKRQGSPINITNYIKLSASQSNDILFYWINDIVYPQGFVVELILVLSLSASDLLQDLKARGIRSPEVSRALVREKLAVDRDSEISATSLRVSLLCPLGKLRMTHPCRSHMCTHLQCFDASIYLQMNERKARWVCPVCDKPALVDSLVVDGLFKEICAEASSNDIEFYSDGSWHPINTKEGFTHSLSPERKPVTVDCAASPVTILDTSVDSTGTGRGGGTRNDPIVIDLSSDEEDEETIPPSRPLPSSTITTITPSTSYTPHIIDPSTSLQSHTSHTSHSLTLASMHGRHTPPDYTVCRDGLTSTGPVSSTTATRSVVVKRRYSSTTEGGVEIGGVVNVDPCATPPPPPPTTLTTLASSRAGNGTVVPLITEYAPSLPIFPYLATQPSAVRTILASSDPLLSNISGVSGVRDFNLDDLQHVYTLSEF